MQHLEVCPCPPSANRNIFPVPSTQSPQKVGMDQPKGTSLYRHADPRPRYDLRGTILISYTDQGGVSPIVYPPVPNKDRFSSGGSTPDFYRLQIRGQLSNKFAVIQAPPIES